MTRFLPVPSCVGQVSQPGTSGTSTFSSPWPGKPNCNFHVVALRWVPSGNLTESYWKSCQFKKWIYPLKMVDLSIVMLHYVSSTYIYIYIYIIILVYQRDPEGTGCGKKHHSICHSHPPRSQHAVHRNHGPILPVAGLHVAIFQPQWSGPLPELWHVGVGVMTWSLGWGMGTWMCYCNM